MSDKFIKFFKQLILPFLFFPILLVSQSGLKEYSKDIALYQAKFFIISEILGPSLDYDKFVIDPLAASKSSEITSIFYDGKNKKGLVLGFFDDFWVQDSGSSNFKGYSFKNIEYEKAIQLLNKIESIIENEKKFLNEDDNENNIYFNFEEMVFLIYREGPLRGRIRISWNNFDGEWENTAFRRTKRRFEKSIN